MSSVPASSNRVALLGRGDAALESAGNFLADLGVQPVVIDGAAVDAQFIERLDALRDLDFAVVALGTDDVEGGGLRRDLLLQVGFLLGAIGRGRICCLGTADLPATPELGGAIRHTLDDAGLWKLLLAREMRRSGLDIDMNKAL